MTNIDEVQHYLWDWVNNCLNVPSSDFAGFPPCPYSRRAMLEKRVEIRWFHDLGLLDILNEIARTWKDDFDMVILATDPKAITYKYTTNSIMQANRTILARQDLVALRDHPDAVSHLPRSSASTNGKYLLVFVQRLSKLLEATEYLSRAGYYQHWSTEELENEINWRFQLVKDDQE